MSRFGLEIRAASPGDAAALAELFRSVGVALAPAALAERIEAIRRADGQVLLAWEWGPPSGVIAFSRYATLAAAAPTAQVTALLVGADARRRGVARTLLKAASQAARQGGCDTLQLAVDVDQPELRVFCEATGFSAAGPWFTRPLRKRA